MRRILLAACCTMGCVCLPAFPDFELSAAIAERLQGVRGHLSSGSRAGGTGKNTSDPSASGETLAQARSEAGGASAPGTQEPAPAAQATASPEVNPVLSRNELCSLLAASAEENELPVGFFVSLIWQESRFEHRAISPAGALGVAQFMPAVAENLGVDDPFDPREALPASARLLRTLHARFGNLGLAAAAYNAGPKRVLDWLAKRSKLPKETRDYVQIITGIPAASWSSAKLQPIVYRVSAKAPCLRVNSLAEQVAAIPQAKKSPLARRAAKSTRVQLKSARNGKVISGQAKRAGLTRLAELRARSR